MNRICRRSLYVVGFVVGWGLVFVSLPLVIIGYLLTIPLDWIERGMKELEK